MRFTNRIRKEISRRIKFAYHHDKILILKSIFSNQNLPIHLRYRAQIILAKKYKKNSLSKINRYCLYSSNFRSVSRKFKLSRGFLRNFASRGLIVGLYKQ
jgi:ribosomal protein S14